MCDPQADLLLLHLMAVAVLLTKHGRQSLSPPAQPAPAVLSTFHSHLVRDSESHWQVECNSTCKLAQPVRQLCLGVLRAQPGAVILSNHPTQVWCDALW